MGTDAIKMKVGYQAAEFVKEGMRVGLGTGSTAHFFIERLIQRCKEGLKISAIATSKQSHKMAQEGGIPLLDAEQVTELDLTVDGADEIDSQKRMIKGGGGALVREKIIAAMSKELIVIVDASKLVHNLGKVKLPVEIVSFATRATIHHIDKAGFRGDFRKNADGTRFSTDNNNAIFDIHLPLPCENPEKIHQTLIAIPGVVDTGFFFHLAGRVIVGFADGQVVVKT
ncbi:MAG: ribose-5-phosphate isomerase RpiA [Chlamydiota bacterium]